MVGLSVEIGLKETAAPRELRLAIRAARRAPARDHLIA
jgi:hypothetical protein